MVMNRKANLNPIKSIKFPQINGIIAPPTMAIHNKPDPFGFNSPIPLIANVKIVGNIIELNKPTARILHMDSNPVVLIEIIISKMATEAKMLKTFPGFMIFVRYEPTKRPIIAPDQ